MKTKNWKSIQPGNDIWCLVGPEYIKGAKLPTTLLIFKMTVKMVKPAYEKGRRVITKNGSSFHINGIDLNKQVLVISKPSFDLYSKATVYGTNPIVVLKLYKEEIKKFLESVCTGSKYITELCISAIEANERLKSLIEEADSKENTTLSNAKIGDKLYGVPLAEDRIHNTGYRVTTLKFSSINSTGDLVFTGEDETVIIPKSQTDQRTYLTKEYAWALSENRAYKYLQENAVCYFNKGQESLEKFEDLEKFGNRILELINEEIINTPPKTLITE